MDGLWEGDLQLSLLGKEALVIPTTVDDLPIDRKIEDGEVFLIRNCESRYLTHLFHKYPGKFIPQIPRWALNSFLPLRTGAVVLDPFVGSGTTLVEGSLHGQSSYGLDVDPLARLISKVKTTVIPEKRLTALISEVTSALDSTVEGSFCPAIPTLSHWFNEQAILDLSVIYDVIEQYRNEPDIYDFLLVCFSAIIRRASNADNQTMKTYVSHTNPKTPEPARVLFSKTLYIYVDRLIKFGSLVPVEASVKILEADDARSIDELWEQQGLPLVDCAITSPPYIKSVDYIYNQMAELFWIGHRWNLETQTKQNAFKHRYIGHDRPESKKATTLNMIGLSDVDNYITQIFNCNRALALVAWRYFHDMCVHLRAMKSILRPGAHYVVVIGDSTLAGIPVPTHSLLISCAKSKGFRVNYHFAYEVRNKYMRFPRGGRGGVVVHDWVIDLVNEG